MVKIILQILYIMGLDCAILSDLKEIVYGFLLSKRNTKGAKKIHMQQCKKDRFTLLYIKEYTEYPKQFRRFYKIRLLYITLLIPQYIILLFALTCFDAFWLANLMFILKILFFVVICMPFIENKLSIYDKRNRSKK